MIYCAALLNAIFFFCCLAHFSTVHQHRSTSVALHPSTIPIGPDLDHIRTALYRLDVLSATQRIRAPSLSSTCNDRVPVTLILLMPSRLHRPNNTPPHTVPAVHSVRVPTPTKTGPRYPTSPNDAEYRIALHNATIVSSPRFRPPIVVDHC